MLQLAEITDLLNTQILNQYHTEIIGGFTEPFYKASNVDSKAQIQFSYDYIRSALHELAHWCVAGERRRKIDDYGYWYAPDGRNQQQQNEFFRVEVKPQALEWAFSIVAGVAFEASVDNLDNSVEGTELFKRNVYKQLCHYLDTGFSNRVQKILNLFAYKTGISDVTGFMRNHLKGFS